MIDFDGYSFEQCLNPYNSFTLIDADSFEASEIKQAPSLKLQEAITSLNPKQPFLNFDLQLTAEDINALNQFHITSKHEYNTFGELQKLPSDLTAFIKTLSTENESIAANIAQLINNLINNVLSSSEQGDTAWVIVRASIATDEFDLPDWHTDPCIASVLKQGNSECKNNEHNVIFSLKGPSTLFYSLPVEKREEFIFKSDLENYLGNETHGPLIQADRTDNDPEIWKKKELAKMLNISSAVTVDFGQGYVFLAGEEYGAVHTAPPINEERLFIAIYPGSKDELKQLKEQIRIANLDNEEANLEAKK